jgi:hypothetical protein
MPVLGHKDKDGKFVGQPYLKWDVDSLAQLEAVGGSYVLFNDPPPETAPEAERGWYYTTNALVYAELLASVQGIPTLETNVRRAHGFLNSSRVAWRAIKDHFVKLSDTNEDQLKRKLQKLVPGPRESMQSLIARAEELRSEYHAYGLEPVDSDFVTQILSHLTLPWRQGLKDAAGRPMGDRPTREIPWEPMCASLLGQDNMRRTSFLDAPDALLPLGFDPKVREQGKARAGAGDTGAAASAGGQARPKAKRPQSGKGGGQARGDDDPLVCYCCFASGHGCDSCPKKTADWKLTPEAREKANRLRKERGEQRRKDKARASAAQGKSSERAPSPPPSPPAGK